MRAKSITMIALLAIAVVGLAGCGSNGDAMGGGKGQVRFVMTSAPAPAGTMSTGGLVAVAGSDATLSPLQDGTRPQLQAANVTFTSFLARNLDGQLVSVSAALPFTVDVLQVASGGQVTLPMGFLPPGTYDQIVVVMSTVEIVTADGTKIAITPPGGGWTAIVNVVSPFVVVEGEMTTIDLKFKWWKAFRMLEGKFHFEPEFDCEHD